ncbi:type IIG restriction enzyme/methyltransferase [Enterococcus faecium]|uniref:type IIG restriction enzyme/methyltransferase n=1 Tax=Enterococcus faecium TaxID=1352 RepID=UPI000774FDED|nr:TaqI-like C-terminal specificity domain-containing protein [Enterococcus faecium]KXS07774.1 type II restriction endonuclease [Enterococcus faecium]MCM6878407.1 Eco57I restriction-modification methylase domain-containing protein [Enterococcus faecium]
MAITGLTLKQSINKNVQAIMPQEDEKDVFERRLTSYLETLKANQQESEEYQKNLLSDFLKSVLEKNYINTSNRVDLAIYNGQDSSSSLGVIIETKRLNNTSEMMTKQNINAKAFQELVSYYLYERINSKNVEIKKGIVTNGFSWFVIEAKELEKYFYNNKKLRELYIKWQNNQLSSPKTDFLYNEVIKPEIDIAIDKGITIAHFNLKDALISFKHPFKLKKNNLTQLYRFFSAENLLNKEIFTDSNKLNKAFYDELLYIMGLEEKKKGTSKVIQRLSNDKRQYASLVESTITRLNQNDVPEYMQYDNAIQLVVVWINRILFLKLLESQLVAFNHDIKFKFLTYEKIKNYGDLSDLFFGILAKRHDQRDSRLEEKFGFIPYLNSSLFEETELEKSRDGITIDRLREEDIQIYSKTVLKGRNGKRKTGMMDFHEYLFEFLDAYDFSTTIKNKRDSKNDLINASVLGLIFEKINGYADGSFFTPGKITMYMSRRSLRVAAIDKINLALNWNAKTIEDVKFRIDNIEIARKVGKVIDSLKICDPAVGSGHFLVSMLNEIISLKNELHCLFDADGKILNDIHCYVANDELIIQDFSGNNFSYSKGNVQATRIQKALFIQKQTTIENCLFGVDINPNSVNICRLRLWIELLKNSYYDNSGELVTLPNIDINIKVGDSLLHKFDFNFSFDMRKSDFKEYLTLVKEYKNTNNKRTKAEMFEKILEIKRAFDDKATNPEIIQLKKLESELSKAGVIDLFGDDEIEQKRFDEISKKVNEAQKELEESIKNPMFSHGMEWRMEFPEILDDNGKFIGFDLIIGNPPYIYSSDNSFSDTEKSYYLEKYPLNKYQANTFGLFIELGFYLLREGGTLSFIVPNSLLTINQYKDMRKYLVQECGDLFILNSKDKIFDEASIDVCIISANKSAPNSIILAELEHGDWNIITTTTPDIMSKFDVINISSFKNENLNIIDKIERNSRIIENNYGVVKDGLKAYESGKGTPKQPTDKEEFKKFKESKKYYANTRVDETYRKFLNGADLQRYSINWSHQFIQYGKNLAAPRNPKIFQGERILIARIPVKSRYVFRACYTNDEYVHEQSIESISNLKAEPFYLLGVLNSKIVSYYAIQKFDFLQRNTFPQMRLTQIKQFPIPNATDEQQRFLSGLVRNLMGEFEKEKPDKSKIADLNIEIDEYVMDIFDLNESEKESIRDFEVG